MDKNDLMEMDEFDFESKDDIVEELLAEFNDELHTGKPDVEKYLGRCPVEQRQELRSLINVLLLADRALAPLRKEARLDRMDKSSDEKIVEGAERKLG